MEQVVSNNEIRIWLNKAVHNFLNRSPKKRNNAEHFLTLKMTAALRNSIIKLMQRYETGVVTWLQTRDFLSTDEFHWQIITMPLTSFWLLYIHLSEGRTLELLPSSFGKYDSLLWEHGSEEWTCFFDDTLYTNLNDWVSSFFESLRITVESWNENLSRVSWNSRWFMHKNTGVIDGFSFGVDSYTRWIGSIQKI